MDGQAIWVQPNGERFKGTFKNGVKHGKAVEIQSDGTKIECEYVNGVREGNYREYDKNGNLRRKGKYVNGRFKQD